MQVEDFDDVCYALEVNEFHFCRPDHQIVWGQALQGQLSFLRRTGGVDVICFVMEVQFVKMLWILLPSELLSIAFVNVKCLDHLG